MMTTEQILEEIRHLPAVDRDRIRRELETSEVLSPASEESVQKMMQISGRAKVGRFLKPELDREFLYSEDPA